MESPGTELASIDFGNLIGGPLNAVITAQANAAKSTRDFIKETGFDKDDKPIYVDFKYPKEVVPYVPSSNPYLLSAKVKTDVTGFAPNEEVNVIFKTATVTDTNIEATGIIKADSTGKIAGGTFFTIQNKGDFKSKPDGTIGSVIDECNTIGASLTMDIDVETTTSTFNAAKPAVFQEMKFSVPILTMLPVPFIKVDEITIDFNAKINSVQTQSQNTELGFNANLEARYGSKNNYVKLTGSVAYKKTTSSGSSVERTYSMAIHVKASQDEMPAGMEKLLNILEGAMISTPGEITSGN